LARVLSGLDRGSLATGRRATLLINDGITHIKYASNSLRPRFFAVGKLFGQILMELCGVSLTAVPLLEA